MTQWLLLVALALTATPGSAPDHRLGAKDRISIRVFGDESLGGEFVLAADGSIDHPEAGRIELIQQSIDQAATTIQQRLVAAELLHPERGRLSVDLLEANSATIRLLGAFSRPGTLTGTGWTLRSALNEAGGLASNHGNEIRILRRSPRGIERELVIDAADVVVRFDPLYDIPLLPNDEVRVPQAQQIRIYVNGEVNRPGELVFGSNDRVSLLTAIVRAGDLKPRAKATVRIIRENGEQLEVNYKRIRAGKDPDVPLRRGDVITVLQAFFY